MGTRSTKADEQLDEAIVESFPASDVPAVSSENSVYDNKDAGRLETVVDGLVASLPYRRGPGVISLGTPDVPGVLMGRGVEDRLARFALQAARREGAKALVEAGPVAEYAMRHPEYAAVIVTDTDGD